MGKFATTIFTWTCLLAFGLLPSSLPAQSRAKIETVLWGFDGHVRPEAFNPLTVLVVNPTDRAIDGVLTVRRSAIGAVGARLERPCFLSPRSRRWVQFSAFVVNDSDGWALTLLDANRRALAGKALNRKSRPKPGRGAAVLLTESRELAEDDRYGFPASLFPTTVLATRGLAQAALDHVPELEQPARQALLQWLHGGGELIVLQRNGRYPEFEGELAVLNGGAAVIRVGRGRVERRAATAVEYRTSLRTQQKPLDKFFPMRGYHAGLLKSLRAEFSPAVSWGVLYVLGGIFVLLVGPVYRWVGLRFLGWRTALLFLAVTVVGTTVVFERVGRRGDGERELVRTATLVRPVGPEFEAEEQHAAFFVTFGDRYTFGTKGGASLFSTAQSNEAVRGVIQNGRNGRFTVELPLYSWRSFVRTSLVRREKRGPRLLRWPVGAAPDALSLDPGDWLPAELSTVLCVHGTKVWELLVGTAIRGTSKSWDLAACRSRFEMDQEFQSVYYGERPLSETLLRVWPLIEGDLDLWHRDLAKPVTSDDSLVLYFVIDKPRSLRHAAGAPPTEGFTVYRYDLEREPR